MKYLKLWEAFKSEILSKNMAFLSDRGKEKFMDELKRITNYISYPLSELSDEYFQKLNFDKALKLNFNREDSVCDATSDRSYPDHAVPGAICDKGMVDRKWGRGIRKAQCSVCGGTGIKPVSNPNPKWVKFWFDKNGNYITKSAVDGVIRGNLKGVSGEVTDTKSGIVYKKESEIASQFINFPTGTKFWINLGDANIIATLFKQDGICFMIQDVADGGNPNGRDWKKFGRYSWMVRDSRDFRGKAYLLKEKTDEEEDNKAPNPYFWNAKLDLSRRTMSCTQYPDLEEDLRTASFAIVLNVLDLYKSGYKTLVSTRKEREESKSGALALMTDEQIRDANAQKYLQEISKRIKISSDLTNLKRGVTKIIGSNFVGVYIFAQTMTNNLNLLESHIYYIMKSDDIDYYVDRANNLIKGELEVKSEQNGKISINLDSLVSTLSTSDQSDDKKLLEIILKLKTFIQLTHEIVSVKTINSIRDIEILRQKFQSVQSVIKNSKRFSELWSILQGIVGWIYQDNDISRILRWIKGNDTVRIDMALEQMDEFIETSKELLK